MSRDSGRPITLLGMAGALRRASTNRGMLRAAAELLPAGVGLTVGEIGDLPLYDMDLDPSGGDATGSANADVADWPTPVARLRRQFDAADAVLVAVGVNNLAVPAPLLNALAWLSRPDLRGDERVRLLRGKTFGLMGSGGARGGADGREAFSMSVGALGAVVIEESVDEPFFSEAFDPATGDVIDDALQQRIGSLVGALVRAVRD